MKKKKPARKQQQGITAKSKAVSNNSFSPDKILSNYGLPVTCALLFILLLILFNHYIFSNRLLLFKDIGSDTYNTFWPQFFHYSQSLRAHEIPKWIFSQGLGQNNFPAMLGDIFTWPLYIVNPENLPYMFVYSEMLKMLTAGIFFFLFLKKTGITTYSALTGAVLFTFSGFMTVGAAWYTFTTESCYLMLMLYGMELLRQNNNLFVFPVAIALLGARFIVFLYLGVLLIVGYLLFFIVLKGFNWLSRRFIVNLILLGILGTGMSALLLSANIYQMLESPRGSGNVSQFVKLTSMPVFHFANSSFYYTFLLRMFGNDMMGSANLFKGWKNYLEAPASYCGLLGLLLLPQLFVLANKKVKWVSGIILGVVLLPVVFPYLRYTFWLFTGDYFRNYAFFLIILQLALAMKTLDYIIQQKKINSLLLAATFIILTIILFTCASSNASLQLPVFLFLCIEFSLLLMIVHKRYYKAAVILLPLAVFAEMIFLSSGTFNNRETINKSDLRERTGYNDFTTDAIKYLQTSDKEFYRLQKDIPSGVTPFSSLNDAMIQNYYSSSSYSSFNQKYYVIFLQKMGLISDTSEKETRWIPPLSDFLVMQLISNKYYLTHRRYSSLSPSEWNPVTNISGIGIWKTKYFLPLGITYSSCISEKEMSKLPSTDNGKYMMILKAAVIKDSTQNGFTGLNTVTAQDALDFSAITFRNNDSAYVSLLKEDTLQITSFSDNNIAGNINTPSRKLLFFSIPYDKGWSAIIDGKKVAPLLVNYGFLGFMLDKGPHKVELNFQPVYYEAGMKISLISLLVFAALITVTFIVRKRKS